ncbi:MAG: flagellar filament capping protein FliD, partial [Defluviitaleaceae bacterium]|nr:flagellar filament capping protein FliD [Defluviitaleaceae bacterium]
MFNNITRFTGLSTGLDTQALVTQMMRAESMRYNKLIQRRQKLEWKQQDYRMAAGALRDFQNSMLSLTSSTSLRLNSTFYNFKTSVTGADGLSVPGVQVSVKSAATARDFSVTVHETAKKDVYVGDSFKLTYAAVKEAPDVATAGGDPIISSIIGFDETGRFSESFFLRLDDGTVTRFQLDKADNDYLMAVFDDTLITNKNDEYYKRVATIFNDKFIDRYGYDGSTHTLDTQKVRMVYDGGSFSFVATAGHKLEIFSGQEHFDILKKLGFSGSGVAAVQQRDEVIADLSFSDFSFTINGKQIDVNASRDSMSEIMYMVNNSGAGVLMSFDSNRGAYRIESARSGAAGAITAGGAGLDDFLNLFNFPSSANIADARVSAASDARFEHNGMMYYRESNTFEIDGVSITVNEATLTKDASDNVIPRTLFVSLARDTTETFNTLKKFVDEYNKLLDFLNNYVITPRAKNGQYSYYEPLTDDQRREMKEREVELWENKAKAGMLYRDDILSNLTGQMRRMLYEKVEYDIQYEYSGGVPTSKISSKSISLFQIGITTSNRSGNIGKLELDERKLLSMLENDVGAVNALFNKRPEKPDGTFMSGVNPKERNARMAHQGLAERLNDIIDNAIAFGGTIYQRAGLEETSSVM